MMLSPLFTAFSENVAALARITIFAFDITSGLRKDGAMPFLKFSRYRKGLKSEAEGAQRHADDKSGNSMLVTFNGIRTDYAHFRG